MSWRSRLRRSLWREVKRVPSRETFICTVILPLLSGSPKTYPRGFWPWKQSWLGARMMAIRGFDHGQILRHSKEQRRQRA